MIHHILLPLDLTDHNSWTVTAAADIAARHDATVTLLHVIETVQNVPFEDLRDFYENLQAKAESVVTELEEAFKARQIPTARAIVYGNRLEEILNYARKEASDLILMASHTVEENQQHPRWGSLSHGIAILAPCSVMLLRRASGDTPTAEDTDS